MRENKELMTFEPGALMQRMFRDFDRLFEVRSLPVFRPFRREFGEFAWSPDLEVLERNHHFVAWLDLPGLKKDEISVDVADNELTISGERKKESEETKNDWFRSERMYGSFSRTIPLPEGVKPSDITATFTNGVLEVTFPVPAKAEATTRKIAIGEPTAGKKTVAA